MSFFTVLYDVVSRYGVGSLCNYLTYILDKQIQVMLKGKDANKIDLARDEVGLPNWAS